ncbi:MAG: hypothetical protein VYB54_00200 [Pseudomonadota bacterium]|nr:hypothetical protein [Pseudomonadota bacterium]
MRPMRRNSGPVVLPTGIKSFICRYKTPEGRERRRTTGVVCPMHVHRIVSEERREDLVIRRYEVETPCWYFDEPCWFDRETWLADLRQAAAAAAARETEGDP